MASIIVTEPTPIIPGTMASKAQTQDAAILAARRRDQRNLLTSLLLARGTPMLSMGAELGQTQHGNNNAYAQDNASAWLDWAKADLAMAAFVRALIDLRRATPAFTRDCFLEGAAQGESGLPDVEWRGADGEVLSGSQWREGERRFLAAFFCAGSSRAALLFNASHESAHFRLPQPREGFFWRRIIDTRAEDGAGDHACFDSGETLVIAPRSALALVETPDAEGLDRDAAPETLDLLARAAGIAPDWHDISGARHIVPDATKRAILASMGLPAQTQGEARDSLRLFAAHTDRRALPFSLVFREGEPIEAPLASAGSHARLLLVRRGGRGATIRFRPR